MGLNFVDHPYDLGASPSQNPAYATAFGWIPDPNY